MIEITDYQNINQKQQLFIQNLGFCHLHKHQQLVAFKFDNDLENNFLKCLECLYSSGTQNTFPLTKLFENDQNQVIKGWPILVDDAQIYQNLFEVERFSKEKYYLKENQIKANYFFKELRKEINNLIDNREQYIKQEIEEQQSNYDNVLLQYNKISYKEELKEALLNNQQQSQEQDEILRQIISKNIKNQQINKMHILNLLAETQKNKIDFENFQKIQKKVLNLIGSIGTDQNQNNSQGFLQLDINDVGEIKSSELLNNKTNQNRQDQQINQHKLVTEKHKENEFENDQIDQVNTINKEITSRYQQLDEGDYLLKRNINEKIEEKSLLEKQNNQSSPQMKGESNDLKYFTASKKQANFEQLQITSQQSKCKTLKSQMKVQTIKSSLILQFALVAIIVLIGWVCLTKQGNQNTEKFNQKQEISLESDAKNFEEKTSQNNIKNNSLTIDLKNRQLNQDEINKFQIQMEQCQSIKSLNLILSKCNIDGQTVLFIAKSLLKCQNIISLNINLSLNNIGQEGVAIILDAIKNIQNINSLNLNLNQNNIGDQGVKNFAEIMHSIKTIKSLNINFSNNNISQEGSIYLSNYLKSNLNLNSLNIDFSNNSVGNQGLFYISLAIENEQNINSLNFNFSNNQINDSGIENIANLLSKLKKMNSLVLQFGQNQIGDEGLRQLFETLKNLQKINSLNLNFDGNIISNEGVKHMTIILEKLQNLNFLNINFSDNYISQQVIRDTKTRLEKTNIKKIILQFC